MTKFQTGGRTVNLSVDAAAAAAGVTVSRPAGFTGLVTVTATDAVLAARTSRVSIRFR